MVEFLATGLSDYVTGAVIPIDVAATVGVRLLSRAVLWPRRAWGVDPGTGGSGVFSNCFSLGFNSASRLASHSSALATHRPRGL